ncbi:MAG TPA: GAF domain-containing protein [Vicinamibacterales bacterium]|nr:GAF domain-containing protein [Vicinamibacterales bacterium]
MSEPSVPRIPRQPVGRSSHQHLLSSLARSSPNHTHSNTEKGASENDAFLLALEFLRESEVRLRLALDAADMGTFLCTIRDDRCEPDRRLLALLGLPPGRAFTRAEILALIHPDDRARAADAFVRATVPEGTGTLREEIRVLHADGTVRWMSIAGQTTFKEIAPESAHGRLRRAIQMAGVAADITDRKRHEADLVLLDQIADDCARLSSAEDIIETVGLRIGAYLHATAVGLADVDESRDEIRIVHMWNEAGSPTRPDVVRLSDFLGVDVHNSAMAGETLVVHDTDSDPRTDAKAHEALQVRAFISVPFVRGGAWKYSLGVFDSRPHRWRHHEISLFRRIADRLFARLEHAIAEQAVASDLRDTQLLRDLSVRLVSESDTQAFFDAIVAAAISTTGAKAGCLQLLDGGTNELVLLAHHGFDPGLAPKFSRVNASSPTSCGRALARGQRAVVNLDEEVGRDATGSLRLLVDAGVRFAQSTPLTTRAGHMVGVLSTHWSESRHRLSERERRFLDMLARQAAEMIERRRHEDALRESEQRLSAELADTQLLQRLSAQLIEGQGSGSLYETLVDAAKSIMHSDFAAMQMLYPDRGPRGELRLIASRGFDDAARRQWEWVRADANTTCGRALRIGERVIAPNIAECEFMAGTIDQHVLIEAGIHAAQTTPLVSRSGKILGMITTHWSVPHQPSDRDLRLFDILARQAADLIERTQSEDALRRSESQLKEADRLKDEFLATLAHELRNPLAPLRTSLELIRLPDNTREEVEEIRVMMEEQVALLVRLVDDLLDVSRITSGKIRLQRQPSLLASLVGTAVQANRAAIDAGQVTLHVVMPEIPVLLDVDPTRFVQVISNVLNNAIKFTDPGGQITVVAELSQSTGARSDEVVIGITDSGVGIPQEMLPRVFELFTQGDTTAHRSHTGLGIGLALSRRLIEMHGGTIEAHSDGPGSGSTFRLRMPVSQSVEDTRPSPPPPVALRISQRVVVIDDNPAAARSIQRLVTALGGECLVAHNGETGLAHIRELRPDIVILDIGMPRVDGYETCRRIREEFGPGMLIVALTGWGQDRDKQHAMEAGFDVHLTKPADPVALEQLLANVDIRSVQA